jgi:hypothetical protein
MKQAFWALCVVASVVLLSFNHPVWAETTQVCVDVKDKAGEPVKDKAGKVKQNCRTMKKHQKLEGTKVPEKK